MPLTPLLAILAIPSPGLDASAAARFAELALACVAQEYPNKISHVMSSDEDARPPRALTPAFYGCYDWHSAVHGHWLLARLARTYPEAPFAAAARAALARAMTPANMSGERRYLEGEGRVAFERPYGLAWLLQLAAELMEWDSADARAWSVSLAPLADAAAARIGSWLPKLTAPIRVGVHDQTAFAFGLILDWARTAGNREMEDLLTSRSLDFYRTDRDCPVRYEPSGHDFLSPCLAEADLMRRILPAERFAAWLDGFLPDLPRDGSGGWMVPAVVTDPGDPHIAHLDGLNLSRAWMLEGIAAALPPGDTRRTSLASMAAAHRRSGLAAVTGAHYEGGHWLGTFAVYLTTARGLGPAAFPRGTNPPGAHTPSMR
jgi:Protein of unknown function (DUF2891)